MTKKPTPYRITKILEYELPLQLEHDSSGGYVAYSPAWQDCYAQGDTIDEAIAEATAVAVSLVELYREEGLPISLKKSYRRNGLPRTLRVPLYVSA